ncbi:DHH family phosphoesterase [Oscillibacter hominis]|uniref:DHH family phosphoesterase n=1 Tax=Oscillibacter hominis TaxID=2763056 RepID=A0A7G9B2P6_9FIRM|nr:DHH family phosphoesterase [Oscillibacter hominis]QNL43827.1 DHH family phosphoesterase [Oscillibacter hominis]
MTAKEAAQLLRTFDNVLILTHMRPDGDTVGCAGALCAALRNLGKTAYLLPNPEITDNSRPYAAPYLAPDGFCPEKVVSTDIAALSLFPQNALPYQDRVDLAIDHHPSYEGFGANSCVQPQCAACGEILYEIARELGPITPEIALPLYVAVSTDTGCFVYSNTTANTHRVAAALMDTGIDYRQVNKTFFRTKSRKRLALEADMLRNMQLFDSGRIVVMQIPVSLMEEVQASESDAEDLSSLAGLVEGNDCAVTMRELRRDVWKISLRTGSRVNATQVCQLLGGGGHAAAAGCTIEGSAQSATEQILDAVARIAGDFPR